MNKECQTCEGTGIVLIKCDSCEGSGNKIELVPCSACNHTGNREDGECATCGGVGFVEHIIEAGCPSCYGQGQIPKECPDCKDDFNIIPKD